MKLCVGSKPKQNSPLRLPICSTGAKGAALQPNFWANFYSAIYFSSPSKNSPHLRLVNSIYLLCDLVAFGSKTKRLPTKLYYSLPRYHHRCLGRHSDFWVLTASGDFIYELPHICIHFLLHMAIGARLTLQKCSACM